MNFYSQSQSSEADTPFFQHDQRSIFSFDRQHQNHAYKLFNQEEPPRKPRSILSQLEQQAQNEDQEEDHSSWSSEKRNPKNSKSNSKRGIKEQENEIEEETVEEEKKGCNSRQLPMRGKRSDSEGFVGLMQQYPTSEPIYVDLKQPWTNSQRQDSVFLKRGEKKEKEIKPLLFSKRKENEEGPFPSRLNVKQPGIRDWKRTEEELKPSLPAEEPSEKIQMPDSRSDSSNKNSLPFTLQVTSDFPPLQKKPFSLGVFSSRKEKEEGKKAVAQPLNVGKGVGNNNSSSNVMESKIPVVPDESKQKPFFLGNLFKKEGKGRGQEKKSGEINQTEKKLNLVPSPSKELWKAIESKTNADSGKHGDSIQKEPKQLGLREQLKRFSSRPTEKLPLKSIAQLEFKKTGLPLSTVLPPTSKTILQPPPLLARQQTEEQNQGRRREEWKKNEKEDSWFVRTMLMLGEVSREVDELGVKIDGAVSREWEALLLQRQLGRRLDVLVCRNQAEE